MTDAAATVANLGYRPFDADNHYYEGLDAFSRHLDPRHARRVFEWAKVDKRCNLSDVEYAKRLYAEYNVTVLPGSYLARDAHGINPGQNRIRMALVAEVEECLEAAHRIVEFTGKLARR